MLDTVLEIGRILRASPDGLRHHRYIKRAPVPDEKRNPVRFWTVPTGKDGDFSFSAIEPLDDEYVQMRLFYLNYKQSDADSTKPYLYGDIYRTVNKGVEDGNFRFGDPTKKSWMALNSFQRAENITALVTDRVKTFRDSFRDQVGAIETFLRANPNVYVHFDFNGNCWHELEEVELLNQSLLGTFFEETKRGYILKAFLYKTLGPGASSTQGFLEGNQYKNRVFADGDQAMDLIYGINYASRRAANAYDVKIVVLPKGPGLTAKHIERFFERTASKDTEVGEAEVQDELSDSEEPVSFSNDGEPLLSMAEDNAYTRNIAQFDFIFSKAGGTKADVDMIELAGLERSKLTHIKERTQKIREEVEEERISSQLLLHGKPPKKPLAFLSITRSFLNILSNRTRSEKKYQSHLFKVLPQFYTETYFHDPVLLPAFIEKTEANIRNGAPNYNLLKFDFYFLTRLQNRKGDPLMEIQSSRSYRVGILLGKLARGLSNQISSFDKNYAGLLSRRIISLSDVMKLQNEFNQKLILHDRKGTAFKFSHELTEEIKGFEGTYNSSECAFGFFESYFTPSNRLKEGEADSLSVTIENNDLEEAI